MSIYSPLYVHIIIPDTCRISNGQNFVSWSFDKHKIVMILFWSWSCFKFKLSYAKFVILFLGMFELSYRYETLRDNSCNP